jgi:hypothetical protein
MLGIFLPVFLGKITITAYNTIMHIATNKRADATNRRTRMSINTPATEPTVATLLARAKRLGYTIVGLARASSVDGRRLSTGSRLTPAELTRIEETLRSAELRDQERA